MSGASPLFSVIMATWGRGRHILPSIQSALAQDFTNFELIVVGDACQDETEAVVTGLPDPRVRWINLANRCGSQSAPNNAGLAAARGEIVAYLSHDDIWEPDHLSRLLEVYRGKSPADFAVSGAILHMPNGLPGTQVTGIFPDGTDVDPYFFPPSSFSHRAKAIDRIGPWRMPMDIRPPVDKELLLRATGAGLQFRATGVVTVHKFSAARRYLSYVQPDCHEQQAMLASMTAAGHKDQVAALVEAARAGGTYMVARQGGFDNLQPGELSEKTRRIRGLSDILTTSLGAGVTLQHPEEDSVTDWQIALDRGHRKTKANPRPRLLLPVTGGRARLRFRVLHRQIEALGALEFLCNGVPGVAKPGWVLPWQGTWAATYRTTILLREAGPSVLELLLNKAQRPAASGPGIAVGPLELAPLRKRFGWF